MSEQQQFQTHSFGVPSPAPAAPVSPPPPDPVPPDLFEDPFDLSPDSKIVALRSLRKRLPRFVAPLIALLLIVAIGYVWFSPGASSSSPSPTGISQQSFGNAPASGASGSDGSSGDLHVYVVGAVKHPGVYDLPAGARVYQLIAAAGGALPDANLVALNMAAPLTDGQEVYVISKGEIPPTICNRC